ncbi:MAG: ABC transporter ATP-binding protein/permease [Acidobacteria bacterium]|nr:ABC transporter ATP-binding protein/permease [Acidobacteriota bacterium]
MTRFHPKTLKRFIALAAPYWFSDEKSKARWLLVLLVLLLAGDTGFNVFFNQQSGEFTSALAARDSTRFWHSIRAFFTWLLIAVPIYAYYYYVRDTLALHWRRWLTEKYVNQYFADRGYYHLLANPDIDNPDQRISEDIAAFTQQALNYLLVFAGGVLQLAAFSRVLWSISSYLVLFLVLYALIGTTVTFGIFGKKMVALNFNQRRREADFRFGMVRIRENAEAIALYHGEKQEESLVSRLFGKLFANYSKLINWSLRLNFFQYSNSLLTTVLPSVIIAPRVLSGELEVGRIVEATGAFAAILSALALPVDNLDGLSRFAAGIERLDAFAHRLEQQRASRGGGQQKIITREGEQIAFEDVTLMTPNAERTLAETLRFTVPAGKGLMIVGASGVGKSSLLRVMSGLWDTGMGALERPRREDMLFLPQHPYMVTGSLRVQLNYPSLGRDVTDAELREVLNEVNLPELLERCGGFDAEFDFEKVLSAGERQRLAFARVLLNQPRFVLLDEATSALDRGNEAALYRKLKATATTPVSVSHHPALIRYHAQVLELKGGGEWELHTASTFRFTEELV